MPIRARNISKRGRLLVAEDDAAFRELLVAAFRADGHEVVAVANGIDLMDALVVASRPEISSGAFDLVVSDVRMPGATGLQALEQLSRIIPLPPVVLITAFGDPETHAKARSAGVLAIFDKPLDLDVLRDTIGEFLATGVATH